jgi:hypothetical protein
MLTAHHKPLDTNRAQEIWAEYQSQNDLSGQDGKVAAIEPASARVWIGDSGIAIADQMQADGIDAPVYLVRIGSDHFVRKGRR